MRMKKALLEHREFDLSMFDSAVEAAATKKGLPPMVQSQPEALPWHNRGERLGTTVRGTEAEISQPTASSTRDRGSSTSPHETLARLGIHKAPSGGLPVHQS